MAIRIRVYPQNGMVGGNGMIGGIPGAYGANANALTGRFMQSQLRAQKQLSGTQLQYERALWGERLQRVRLEERIAARGGIGGPMPMGGLPYGGVPFGMPVGGVPVGVPYGGMPGGVPYGGMPYGGVPGMPGVIGGSGQTNGTHQLANGPANQRVSNSNTYNVMSTSASPFYGMGFPFGGGTGVGGFLSGLLGALI